jgi:RES domain-containing protein
VRLYRIAPEPVLEDYRGLGASYRDGARWNRAGQPVVYFALSAATALLELANYLPSPRLIPAGFRLGIYEVPDRLPLHTLPDDRLPPDWAAFPYPTSTQTIGGDWLLTGKAFGLLVPSAAVPEGLEKIAVVNPGHPACAKVRLLRSTVNLYNKRTFSGLQ